MKRKIIISTIAVILIAITSVFWMESCRKSVEPIEILNTEEIIKELAEANTPEKAEIAINHLIEKVGIGIIKENSDYELYVINEDQIESLAIAQSEFVNGETAYNIGSYYTAFSIAIDTLETLSNHEWLFTCSLEIALTDLFNDGKTAINNIENPNNAIVITIISEDGIIPENVFLFDSTQIISPVQDFCLNIWMSNSFVMFDTDKSTSEINTSVCEHACNLAGIAATAACVAALGATAQWWAIALCGTGGYAVAEACKLLCHDQGGGK